MSTILKSLAMAAVAVGFTFAAATPASAARCTVDNTVECLATFVDIDSNTGGTCNGAVDTNCSYCAYNGSNVASPKSLCDGNWDNYDYETCGTWVAAQCVVG